MQPPLPIRVLEDLDPRVAATLALQPYQCRAVLDEEPWRCGAPTAEHDGPWCPHHAALYTRAPEAPRPRERRSWQR